MDNVSAQQQAYLQHVELIQQHKAHQCDLTLTDYGIENEETEMARPGDKERKKHAEDPIAGGVGSGHWVPLGKPKCTYGERCIQPVRQNPKHYADKSHPSSHPKVKEYYTYSCAYEGYVFQWMEAQQAFAEANAAADSIAQAEAEAKAAAEKAAAEKAAAERAAAAVKVVILASIRHCVCVFLVRVQCSWEMETI